ncbi:MAG: DUF1854 domain-containing protein [Verrucomicrobiota bacterium JB022]|nr:DUF1854 domain-containing protein [Verrucomicrobiota bacterium JB022]
MTKTEQPHLKLADDGRLLLQQGEQWISVRLRPCFPWSRAGEFLSLRDEDDKELALVEKLSHLDRESCEAVKKALEQTTFVFCITRVRSISRRFELRLWKVDTRQGPRTFTTKLEDWPEQKQNGQILIRDIAGDLYVIPVLTELDAASQDKLWAYLA